MPSDEEMRRAVIDEIRRHGGAGHFWGTDPGTRANKADSQEPTKSQNILMLIGFLCLVGAGVTWWLYGWGWMPGGLIAGGVLLMISGGPQNE